MGYPVNQVTKMAGEPGSGQLLEVAAPARATLIGAAGANVINGGAVADTLLRRVIFHTALAGTVTIAGFQDEGGNATNYVFPVAMAAGSYEFGDVLNDKAALTVTLSSATDYDKVMIVWVDAS